MLSSPADRGQGTPHSKGQNYSETFFVSAALWQMVQVSRAGDDAFYDAALAL